MKYFISYLLVLIFLIPVYSQSTLSNPVNAILDNPDSPELASLILKTSELQAQAKDKFETSSLKMRNTFMVQVISENNLLVQSETTMLGTIQDMFLTFLVNPTGSAMMSDSIDASTPFSGELYVSEGFTVVQFDPANVKAAVSTVRELAKALAAYRDRISMKGFRTPYQGLPSLTKSVIDQFFSTKLLLVNVNQPIGKADPIPPLNPSPEGVDEPEQKPSTNQEQEEEKSTNANHGFPGLPSLDELGEAAEKLKDVLLSDQPAIGKEKPTAKGASNNTQIFSFLVVDSAPVLKSCKPVPPRTNGKDCFAATIVQLAHEKFIYPEHLKGQRDPPTGRVYINFVVNLEGEFVQKHIVRGINPELDENALNALSSISADSPAMMDGKPVMMSFTLPIRVEND